MNATSSRAHTVVTVTFDQISKNDSGQETKKSSTINLVDLAGMYFIAYQRSKQMHRLCNSHTRENFAACNKSTNKPSTSCVGTACYKLSTSLEQAVNDL